MIENVTLGTDPELFLINNKTKKIVSSIGIIPGEKDNPYTDGLDKGFGLQADNVLAEFNIPPCKIKKEWVENINYMKSFIKNYVKNINPNINLYHAASSVLDDDQLQDERAKVFGCDKDYNVYTLEANPKPKSNNPNLRSAGFHVHVGYNNPNIDDTLRLIKYMDVYLGLRSVLYDPDTKRRGLYGKAGCFRLTDYGFEYRVLSGFFLKSNTYIGKVYDWAMEAIEACNEGLELTDSDLIQKAINTSNKKLATELLTSLNITV